MTEPIMAVEVPTPKPTRPRLYVLLYEPYTEGEIYVTSNAYSRLDHPEMARESSDLPFALPGTDDEWTEKKIREATAKFFTEVLRCEEQTWDKSTFDLLVLFATKYLGLGEQT